MSTSCIAVTAHAMPLACRPPMKCTTVHLCVHSHTHTPTGYSVLAARLIYAASQIAHR